MEKPKPDSLHTTEDQKVTQSKAQDTSASPEKVEFKLLRGDQIIVTFARNRTEGDPAKVLRKGVVVAEGVMIKGKMFTYAESDQSVVVEPGVELTVEFKPLSGDKVVPRFGTFGMIGGVGTEGVMIIDGKAFVDPRSGQPLIGVISDKKIDTLPEDDAIFSKQGERLMADDLTEDFDDATKGPSLRTVLTGCEELIAAGNFETAPVEETKKILELINERATQTMAATKALLESHRSNVSEANVQLNR
jgi:hypothetical protein